MENDLYTYTFCREDWELIMAALRARSVELYDQSLNVGRDSTYGAAVYDLAAQHQALADDIDFKLPE